MNIKLIKKNDDYYDFLEGIDNKLDKLKGFTEDEYDVFFDQLHDLLSLNGKVNVRDGAQTEAANFEMYRYVSLSRRIGLIAYSDSITRNIILKIADLLCVIKNVSVSLQVIDRKTQSIEYKICIDDCRNVGTSSHTWCE